MRITGFPKRKSNRPRRPGTKTQRPRLPGSRGPECVRTTRLLRTCGGLPGEDSAPKASAQSTTSLERRARPLDSRDRSGAAPKERSRPQLLPWLGPPCCALCARTRPCATESPCWWVAAARAGRGLGGASWRGGATFADWCPWVAARDVSS